MNTAKQNYFSDASETACRAHIKESGQAAQGAFTLAERETSSTYRELRAMQNAIGAFEALLTGCDVKLLTDSKIAQKLLK